MLDERFIFLGLALGSLGTISYIRSMFQGQAKPNQVTFALWALAPLIAAAAEISEGVGIRSLFTLSTGLNPLAVLIFSFFLSQAHWDIKPRDYAFGLVSVLGLAFWLITGEGILAVVFAIVADAMAAAPTLIKSYRAPDSEDARGYALIIPGAIIALLVIDSYSLIDVAFPLYILVMVTTLTCLIQFKLGSQITRIVSSIFS